MTASSERFCATCGALKVAPDATVKPMQFCTSCGVAQFSTPKTLANSANAPIQQQDATRSSSVFGLRLGLAAALVVLVGSGSFAVTRFLIDKPQSSAEANGTRNGAQNNGGTETNPQAGNTQAEAQASANPMSKVTPEMQQRIAILQDSVQRFPKNGDVLLSLANAWYDVGAFFQAEQHYARYLSDFDKKNVAARVDYAYTLLRQNRSEEAIAETKKALQYEPNRVEALFNLGVIYYGQKNWVEAKAWFEKCIKIAPGTDVAKSAEDIIKSMAENANGSTQGAAASQNSGL